MMVSMSMLATPAGGKTYSKVLELLCEVLQMVLEALHEQTEVLASSRLRRMPSSQ
jgi:predicted RNase H-like HicB family nuclease